jgi:hypothetical protein
VRFVMSENRPRAGVARQQTATGDRNGCILIPLFVTSLARSSPLGSRSVEHNLNADVTNRDLPESTSIGLRPERAPSPVRRWRAL